MMDFVFRDVFLICLERIVFFVVVFGVRGVFVFIKMVFVIKGVMLVDMDWSVKIYVV